MDNHFAKGFFGLPQHCTVVLSSLLALLNDLSYFAADAIGLDQDIVADLGSDIVFMKHEVFFLKAFRGRHYFCRRRIGPLNSNLEVVQKAYLGVVLYAVEVNIFGSWVGLAAVLQL